MRCSSVFIVFLAGWKTVLSETEYIYLNSPTNDEISFMKRYGYLPEVPSDIDFAYTADSISEAVTKLQAFAGLPETGILDLETKKLFRRRRCGMKDVGSTRFRSRRYIVSQGWNKKIITYRVLNGSSTLEQSRVETLMASALAVWAPHGGLSFVRVDSGHADIQVSFVSGAHDDGFAFDGMGSVVAHAFPPPHGAMHFDDDEVWGDGLRDDDEEATDFFAVAVHEIGHALGLSHSNEKNSVMYPYYQAPVEKLHMDDILGMRKLYFANQPEQPVSVETEDETENPVLSHSSFIPSFTKADTDDLEENVIPDLCFTNYDTVQVIQGKIYVFQEEWVWVLSERKQITAGYPKRFHDVFIGLPGYVNTIRTIYEMRHGNVRIFQDRRYWEFDSNFHYVGEGNISEYDLPLEVSELTTVFISNYNNKTYLIEYERFWRFDEQTNMMDRGYPKEMSAWRQMPYPIDAAIVWKKDTYFFRGPRFWRFDNEQIQAHRYYPMPTAQIWFPCEPTPDMERYFTNDEP